MKKIFLSGSAFVLAIIGIAMLCISPLGIHIEKLYKISGGDPVGYFEETIVYARRDIDTYVVNPESPSYESPYTCGITGGGNIIAWYNKQYPELIPGHTAGTMIFGSWAWANEQSPLLQAMFTNLYVAMGSNPSGTTIAGYKTGLTSYVTGKGRTMNIVSIKGSNSNSLNSYYKVALQNNQLLSLFFNGFNLAATAYPSVQSTGNDFIHFVQYAGFHIMTAYGYKEVSYLDSQNKIFRQDSYLYVQTGFPDQPYALLRINTNCIIDDAYITHVN